MSIFNTFAKKFKHSVLPMITVSIIAGTSLTSCSASLWEGVAMGLAGMPTYSYGSYGSYGYTSSTSTSYVASSTSSSSSSKTTCTRCNGSGNCKTCGGSGKVYDYGSASVISKSK